MAKRKTPQTLVSPRTATSSKSAPQVDFTRNELNLLLPAYYLVRDAIEGELAVKGIVSSSTGFLAPVGNGGIPNLFPMIVLTRATRYLPQPNPEDQSAANIARYRAYVQRAVFYNVTSRTLEGLTGQIFLRDPDVTIPPELDVLRKDADGSGLSLDQVANRAVRNCISYGRAGLLVDYPVTDAPITKAQVENGDIRPTLTIYYPWDILNWRVEVIGGQKILTFVVLRELLDETADDGFSLNIYEQYRVLSLDAETGMHQVAVYRKQGTTGQFGEPEYRVTPKDAQGHPFTRIPFTFIGAENNDVAPNKSPLYDLASLNIAHYRNSADYEEACYIAGQPTPVIKGLDEAWVKNQLKGKVTLGSRAAIMLPVGADASLLQAQPNSLPIEAMKAKEQQMVAIGAKLVQAQKTSRTATQQIIETTSESSPLANISKNVSSAIEFGLKIAAQFVGSAVDTIKYQLNKDFDLTSMTADDQNAVVAQWQKGAIDFSEMRTVLKRAGTAVKSDDDARASIKKDIADGLIPDPALMNAPNPNVPAAKEPSDAGGRQPGSPRQHSSPGTTA